MNSRNGFSPVGEAKRRKLAGEYPEQTDTKPVPNQGTMPPGRFQVCSRCHGRFTRKDGTAHSGTLNKDGVHTSEAVCRAVIRETHREKAIGRAVDMQV